MGHFVVGEEMGHFVAGVICRRGRKWDILSSGTICRPKNAGGTICSWDKMSPNHLAQKKIKQVLGSKLSFFKFQDMDLTIWNKLNNMQKKIAKSYIHEPQVMVIDNALIPFQSQIVASPPLQ